MNARQPMLLLFAALFACVSCSRDPGAAKPGAEKREKTIWPPLPTKGFVAGRPATKDDLAIGDAAFLLGASEPMKIEIPQYAYHIDEQTGKRTPGVVIQAERAPDGKELVAMQPIGGGGYLVAFLGEYKLLGRIPPKDD
jgi:hypothetical protein